MDVTKNEASAIQKIHNLMKENEQLRLRVSELQVHTSAMHQDANRYESMIASLQMQVARLRRSKAEKDAEAPIGARAPVGVREEVLQTISESAATLQVCTTADDVSGIIELMNIDGAFRDGTSKFDEFRDGSGKFDRSMKWAIETYEIIRRRHAEFVKNNPES